MFALNQALARLYLCRPHSLLEMFVRSSSIMYTRGTIVEPFLLFGTLT